MTTGQAPADDQPEQATGKPVGEARASLPDHVLAVLPAERPLDQQAPAPRRPLDVLTGLTGVRLVTASLWAAAPLLLLIDAHLLALACALAAVALTLGPAWLGRELVAVTVRGESMRPAYRDGDLVLVRRDSSPAPGQVVVVERPAPAARWTRPPVGRAAGGRGLTDREWLIKRVAAVPGNPVPTDRVPLLSGTTGELVPPGSLVLLGDNDVSSLDSRIVGYFPADRVLGRVVRPLRT
ncbi:S26 family signal peptidase [Streptomyces sp. NPDC092295]|uniref:S26 family signal peptidase n=1 Tax=Streptomyces sp. NPDC092295 TaxID=3366011 RepID=UPI00382F1EB3